MLEGSAETPGKRVLNLRGGGRLEAAPPRGYQEGFSYRWEGGRRNADLGVEFGFPGCSQGQQGCAGLGPHGREQVRLGGDALLPRQLFKVRD